MKIKDIRIRQGATFQETFRDTDMSAQTLTVTITDTDGAVVGTDTANYVDVDGVMVATVNIDADFPVGNYEYMYTIVYSDYTLKLPTPDGNCGEDNCELPAFIV